MGDKHWTPSLVEERLAEAASVLQRLPEKRVQGYFSAWPEVVRNFWDTYGMHDPVLKRPWPSSASIDRMDEALVWLQWLEPMDAKIVWSRALGERWKATCSRAGLSRTAAWERWVMGLCVIALKLNRQPIPRQSYCLKAMARKMRNPSKEIEKCSANTFVADRNAGI